MKTIGIDKNNDIFLDETGNLAIKKDLSAMGDIFVNKSQTNRGELPYNTEKGIDFFNTVFSSPVYPDLFQNQLLTELEDTEETQRVDNFDGRIEDGVFVYSVDIQTSYGKVSLNG
jgi:hypothetical protein